MDNPAPAPLAVISAPLPFISVPAPTSQSPAVQSEQSVTPVIFSGVAGLVNVIEEVYLPATVETPAEIPAADGAPTPMQAVTSEGVLGITNEAPAPVAQPAPGRPAQQLAVQQVPVQPQAQPVPPAQARQMGILPSTGEPLVDLTIVTLGLLSLTMLGFGALRAAGRRA